MSECVARGGRGGVGVLAGVGGGGEKRRRGGGMPVTCESVVYFVFFPRSVSAFILFLFFLKCIILDFFYEI